jgi:hypothetical protein
MKYSITVLLSVALASLSTACSTPGNFIITFYGYPDNSPPGPDTAHNCGGRNYKAGGMTALQRILVSSTHVNNNRLRHL